MRGKGGKELEEDRLEWESWLGKKWEGLCGKWKVGRGKNKKRKGGKGERSRKMGREKVGMGKVLCRWFRFAQLAKGKKSRP